MVYPTAPTNEKKIAAAKATVKDLIHKYGVTLISVGNGTASRESEQIIVEILKEIPEKVAYVITNEAERPFTRKQAGNRGISKL